MLDGNSYEQLLQEKLELQARLAEAEATLQAMKLGEVDAFVVSTPHGNRIFVLQSADLPYRLLVEQMQQGAVTLSSSGIILFCNQFFANLTGRPMTSLVAHSVDEYITLQERASFREFLDGLLAKNFKQQEFGFQNPNGEVFPVYVSGGVIEFDQTDVICLIFIDLREQKRAEAQSIALEIEKQRSLVLRNFVRDISHDLRTPLSVIMVALASLEYIDDRAKRKEKIQRIEDNISYFNKVLDQLQQTAVLDSTTELALNDGDVHKVIVRAVDTCEAIAKAKNISIALELTSDLAVIAFDNTLLYRTMVELINNAIRFTPHDGHIWIQSQIVGHKHLSIRIIDDGVGIHVDDLPHIFSRFFKGSKARNMTGGAGLGLAISKRIVELHYGRISVDSTLGQGTTITILLPLSAIAHGHGK